MVKLCIIIVLLKDWHEFFSVFNRFQNKECVLRDYNKDNKRN